MIVAMHDSASEDQIQQVIDQLVHFGFEVHRSTGARQTVLGGVGIPHDFDTREIEMLPGVQEAHRITSPTSWRDAISVPKARSSSLPTGSKSRQQDRRHGRALLGRVSRATVRRNRTDRQSRGPHSSRGAFKPRSSPYSFQGLA